MKAFQVKYLGKENTSFRETMETEINKKLNVDWFRRILLWLHEK